MLRALFMPTSSLTAPASVPRIVKIWLITGVVMVFLQIFIGGVTRLTGSGLSITRWEVVTGTVPPLSATAWEEEFVRYQQTPQYQKINRGMTLEEFKFIYFWEYFHRLWARLMFFVFAIPFVFFLLKRWLPRRLTKRLLIVVALAGLEGFFGWSMVASGLIHRPWVNAYNLTLHLTMGIVIFSYLLWTVFVAYEPERPVRASARLARFAWTLVLLAFVQIALGAMVSGTKAALVYPTWPSMRGEYLPALLFDRTYWNAASFTHYDTNPFMPTLLQFLHRNTAYLLTILMVWFLVRARREAPAVPAVRRGAWLLGLALVVQILLGILTLVNSKGRIPVALGVAHQAGAVLLLSVLLYLTYQLGSRREILVGGRPVMTTAPTSAAN
jgi:cytochrome c oxidase assembly protein subunit 15